MARNKISDLRDHLFAALERIDNDDLNADEIRSEVSKAKAKAIAQIGSVLINSAKIELDYIKATGKIDTASDLFKSINDPKQLQ